MKNLILVMVGVILMFSSLYAKENKTNQNYKSMPTIESKDENIKQTLLINMEVYYTDDEADHFRQNKYSLAEGIYTLDPLAEKLEIYLEANAGFQTEVYRFENGYAASSDQKMGIYLAAQAGATYHIIENMSLGAEVTVLNSESHAKHGKNMEMIFNYRF